MEPLLLLGQTLSFAGDPVTAEDDLGARYEEDGALAINADGRIAWCGARQALPPAHRELTCHDYGRSLILPGLIDAHVHFPQYRMLAAPGADLLDWLERFAFPEEARYEDEAHAAAAAEVFLDRLLAHGTTAALVFSTVHAAAAEALFAAAERRGMALISGKTMMDRDAPEALRDEAETGAEESAALFARWHGRGRVGYAVTPRFAVTSSEAQLEACGALLKSCPGALLHSHLSESPGEIAAVGERFPWARDYSDVYDRYGLLGRRALFAHGVHLSERECQRLHESETRIVHCPTSNTFLGSGLFDIDHLADRRRPVRLGVATDVGGGTSYSLLATLGEAHKVARLKGRHLAPLRAFYLATLGNARALHLEQELGSLEPEKWADLVVLDPCATEVLADRQALSETLEDVLFSLMILGDDRAVEACYVAGRRRYFRSQVK